MSLSEEVFYGVTLSATHQSETWEPDSKAEYDHATIAKLVIHNALLGAEAKADEMNVVEAETSCMPTDETIKIPITVLQVGETRHASLDVEFNRGPVTFRLIKGSGPVHLIGQHMLSVGGEFEDTEEIEEEMIEEEEEDDEEAEPNGKKAEGEPNGKKAKLSNSAKGKAASPKKPAKK